MTEAALKEKAIAYVEQLDEKKINLALFYLKGLAENDSKQTNSKTAQERQEAAMSLAELDKIRSRLNLQNSADDDKKTMADAIWKKYAGID